MRLTCVKVKKKPIRDLNGILDSQYSWRNEQQLHRLPFHTFRNCLELFLCFRYFYSFDINSVATRFTNGELYVFTPRFLRNITRGFSRKTSFQTSSTNSPCRQQKQHLRLVPHLTPTQQLKTLSRWSRVFFTARGSHKCIFYHAVSATTKQRKKQNIQGDWTWHN